MDNGIRMLEPEQSGRVEIEDPVEFERFTLRPSEKAVEAILELEESALMAEQRLGMFVVG